MIVMSCGCLVGPLDHEQAIADQVAHELYYAE
jgi:hypothetical protein